MALMTLLVKQLSEKRNNVDLVTATSDFNLFGVHNREKQLLISHIKTSDSFIVIENIETFYWQEDNYCQDDYRLLAVDDQNEIYYYSVVVKFSDSASVILQKRQLAKWNLATIFQSFQELGKSLGNIISIRILKFEEREAVFVFGGKVVVSFYPCSEKDPQIMSIVDLRDDSPFHKKVLLIKEMLFALNNAGTKLFIYSFLNNSKLSELVFSDYIGKNSDNNAVKNFFVNSKVDLLVFLTENGQVFLISLNTLDNGNQNLQSTGTVTAFTKHFPSIKQLNDSLKRYSIASEPLQLLSHLESGILKDLVIVGNKLCFVYDTADSQSLVGVHLLDSDRPTLCHRLTHPAFLIKNDSGEVPFPLLLFSEDRIFLLLYDIEQDKLVNELMIYPSSSSVEMLSSLNNWNNIQMDIKVLILGLSNRQLYTVQFFLKTLFEGFCQLWNSSDSKQWLEKIGKECELWENVLTLLFTNVEENLCESHSSQYAEQLLQVIIGIIIQILSVIENKEVDRDILSLNKKNIFMSTFSKSLLKMRMLLQKQENTYADASDIEDSDNFNKMYNSEILKQWDLWKKLSNEEIIQESILNGCIPMAQSFFISKTPDGLTVTYSEFEKVAEDLVYYYLRQEQLDKALLVLLNMGIDINSKLYEIFKSTPEKCICSITSKELNDRNLLTKEDNQLLKFVSLLEELYPCTSFEHARQLLNEKLMLTEEKYFNFPEDDKKLSVGDFLDFNEGNSETGAYCRIVFNWLSYWNDDVKSRILAPHYLKNTPALEHYIKEDGTRKVDKVSVWNYLLEHGNLPYLINWIDIWLGVHPQNSDGFSALDKWPLTKEMINSIPERATFHVSENLLNELARYGIFCEDESEDISLFLNRIGKAKCNINDKSLFTSNKASLSFSEICHRVMHYCLKHNLVHFLYSFLSNNYDKFSVLPSCHLCQVPLLNLIKSFYIWSLNPKDKQLAYDAVAGAAQYVFKLNNTSAAELLCNVPITLATVILLFKPQPFSESMRELIVNSGTILKTLKEKFRMYPLLFDFLFKMPEERAQPDVTVYELLKGNTIFDTSQLFGWQLANSLKSEESHNELPHFSLKNLSEQYGLKKELTYLYYLMEGRPNYSYLKFIAQEVVLETGLSLSRVRSTCKDVTDYALSNYRCSDICAACVCFVELLGQDSLPLRASLIAVNMLHNAQIPQNEKDSDKSYSDIERKFKQAYIDKDAADSLIQQLEEIIMNIWDPYTNDQNSLFSDIVLWMPVMTLSHLYEVEAGSAYLIECARQNNWLKFLVFAQIFQLPKDQVLKAASSFSNHCISYHIYHALQRKSSLLYEIAYETKSAPPMKTQKRDMRKSYYFRLNRFGADVHKPTNEAVSPSSPTEIKKSPLSEDTISLKSEDTSSISSDIDLGQLVLKDLFSQLLLANSSTSPWECLLHYCYEVQNPILALLAASYPDACLENCFFMWLYSNLCHSEMVQKQLENTFPEVRVTNCSTEDLNKIVILAMRNRKILTLWKGVHLFLLNTPLPTLMGFLRSFMIYKNFDATVVSFQHELHDYLKTSNDTPLLYTLKWIEDISVTILKEATVACSTSYERLIMLNHFSSTRIEKSFSKDVVVPPFMKVYKMVQCLKKLEQDIDIYNLYLAENDINYLNTCWEAVKLLLNCHLYDEAQTFCIAANLPQDKMLMLQINQEIDEARRSYLWNSLAYRAEFWRNIFSKFKVLPLHTVINFVEIQCDISENFGEKYFIMKSAIKLLKEMMEMSVEEVTHDFDYLNKKMWWWCIKAQVKKELIPEIFDVKPVHHFDIQNVFVKSGSTLDLSHLENQSEKEALEFIIGQFLQKKDVGKAFELATTFGYKCNDLEIIETCLDLARGKIEANPNTSSTPEEASDVPSTRIITSLLMWITTVSTDLSASEMDAIICMEKLSRKCTIATSICHQILVHFTISVVLKENYTDVAKEKDAFGILKRILVLKLNDEYILAKSLIVVDELPDREVARFLSEEIWHSLQMLCCSDLVVMIPEEKSAFAEQLVYDPLRTKERFQLIVKLCQDPSLLGNALLNISSSMNTPLNSLSTDSPEMSPTWSDQNFNLLVELIICAHECFVAACNMDGISQILHNAHSLITVLEETGKFSIMVHLLTGLGRYSEMMYVFDILKSKEKLTMLFEKKREDVNNLRMAVLDYLKRCPSSAGDKMLNILAEQFGMYREKAEILEMSVQKQLSQLCKRNAVLDNDLKEELEKALKILTEAAKSYCEADCLHQAQNCTHLAQLIALQIYFVPSGIWIIGLDQSSVTRFITDHDKFFQAYIVAEEYGNHTLWSQALLHNVVLRGDREYLREFQGYFGLPTEIISDVVKRYQKLPNKNENSRKNLKFLLSFCSDVKLKYSVAQELCFLDMKEELLMGEASSYLQDLMANNSLK